MSPQDCFQIGYIARAHGIKGEVKAVFDVQYIEDYLKKESVYISKDDKLTPFSISWMRPLDGQEVLIKFKGIRYRDQADALRGGQLLLPLTDLPALPEEGFYYFEIEGFTVVDENLGPLGTVREVRDMPAQDILVMDYKDKEVLIPVTWEILLRVDKDKREVYTDLPAAHLEVYL